MFFYGAKMILSGTLCQDLRSEVGKDGRMDGAAAVSNAAASSCRAGRVGRIVGRLLLRARGQKIAVCMKLRNTTIVRLQG